ncbi:MAG: C39 family peptidase [Chloroflexi bacterium]|nr:C39 family peptidase [Chloroflexota bacterium]
MSLRRESKARSVLVLLIPGVLGLTLVQQTLMNPAFSTWFPGSGAPGNAASSANGSAGDAPSSGTSTTAALLLPTATPTSTATPTATATPTPKPNNYIWVPWRSQFDGTSYAAGNCGPASLGMMMSYFGEWWSTHGIRKSTMDISGAVPFDAGTDWPALKYAAEGRKFKVSGLYNSGGGYRKWTVDDLVKEIAQKRPVLLLVRQRLLPGHANTTNPFDHYVIFLGTMADGRVVYHDSAWEKEIDGSYKIMSQETLMKAWRDTSVGLQYTAMSLVWEGETRMWDAPTAAQGTPATGR